MAEMRLIEGEKYPAHQILDRDDMIVSATFPDLRSTLAEMFNFSLEHGEEPTVMREPPASRHNGSR